MSHVIITGGLPGKNGPPNRLEINDLIKNNDQFSLYIQALTALFDTSQDNPLSHFGISGIHGLPYVQWEGAGGTSPIPGSQWGGYCSHGSVLFPTWHRPYVALYEQILQRNALAIAKGYQDQDRWLTAAQNLRAPYWDWATNSVPPPEVTSLATVNITTPDGNTTAVPNPLIQYSFHPIDPSFPLPYQNWQTTIRHPDDPDSPNATTDVQALIDVLSSIQDDVTSSTYNLLTRVHTWPAFSNHTPGDGGSASNSLEAIHDEIHGTIGGQMGDPAVAGFDPIFYLHHANVDRLISLWAAVNPGVWVSAGPAEGGTFTIPGDAQVDENTDLTPFWNTPRGFWVSSQTTTTGSLQYSYPEFNGLDLSDPGAVQVAIANYINQQYGGGGSASTASLFAQPAAGGAQPSAAQSPFHSRGGHPHTTHQGKEASGGTVRDWTARIIFKKYELGGSFLVFLFLGEVPADASEWRNSPSFVGAHVAFVNSAADKCNNCRNQSDLLDEGFVHLNAAIAKRSSIRSYEPEVVVPYLQKNLHWRILAANRTAVDPGRLPSLEVTVVETPLTHSPAAIFPITGTPQYHHHITHGRPGGAHHL